MCDDESIFGMNLPVDEYDRLQCGFISQKDYEDTEVELFHSKWFDYRFLHPTQATYLYAHHFAKIYREKYRQQFDRTVADLIRPLKKDDLFECPKHTITGMWRGRQYADAMGMPYELYLRYAFDSVLKYWRQRYLPRSTQLYSDRVVQDVYAKWQELQTARLIFASHPEYLTENYAGTPAQNDHHEWVFAQLKKRGNPGEVVSRVVFEERLLPLDKVKIRLGDEIQINAQFTRGF